MGTYLVQGQYSSESWSAQVANPVNRVEIARKAIESFGGKLIVDYFAFGQWDWVMIMEMPNNEAAAGFVVAIASTGMNKNIQTTVLMSLDEGLNALKNAGKLKYSTPKEQSKK